MITIRLKDLMIQKGIKPTAFRLLKIGIPDAAARAYLNATAKSIRHDHLEILCRYFNCTPKELFEVRPNPDDPYPAGHPMMEWVNYHLPFPMEHFDGMTPAQLEKAEKMLKEIREEGV